MSTLLSLGHGYSARALARLLIPRGWRIIGTTRNPAKAEAFRAEGVEPLLWPGDLGPALAEATYPLLRRAGCQGDRSCGGAEDRAGRPVGSAIFDPGVYGDHDGGWVDEDDAPDPAVRPGRQARWREASGRRRLPVHVFRLAGIYGPGRGPFEKLRDGTARRIIKPGQVFSRIHVDDIAQVLEASIRQPNPGAAYNVCDAQPARRTGVTAMPPVFWACGPPAALPKWSRR
jgi:nucleoside-diphosphate-sugar epimerase